MNRVTKLASIAAGIALAATACGNSSTSSSSGGASTTDWSKATSATAGGGMDALVAAAKKEGTLNAITLPRTWANYGKIMDDFTKKYGIKITDANPDGSSGDEIT